jgi:hypothetical protein
VTLSVPTVPEADDESPYEIFHVDPFCVLNVEDLEGSKIVCPVPWDWVDAGSSVDQTYEMSVVAS